MPERSAPSAVAARWKICTPLVVSSRLRNAATRVTVSLRGPVRGAVGAPAADGAGPGPPGVAPGPTGAAPAPYGAAPGPYGAAPAWPAANGSWYGGRWLPRGACW